MPVKVKVTKRGESKAVYEIEGEDHTLGNLLEKTLLADPRVDFASYENPHPLENKIVLTVVTRGDASPDEVVRDALSKIIEESRRFRRELEEALRAVGREIEA